MVLPPEEGESESWVGLVVSGLEPPYANEALRPELADNLVIWDVDQRRGVYQRFHRWLSVGGFSGDASVEEAV